MKIYYLKRLPGCIIFYLHNIYACRHCVASIKVKKSHQKNPCRKKHDDKTPGKNTLKRKRWLNQKMNSNVDYEDDIYEDKNFKFGILEIETDNSEQYKNMTTPVYPFSLSPRDQTPTSSNCDSYSPDEMTFNRDNALYFNYQRNKRRKQLKRKGKSLKMPCPSPKPFYNAVPSLNEVLEKLAKDKRRRENADDLYFTDFSDDS